MRRENNGTFAAGGDQPRDAQHIIGGHRIADDGKSSWPTGRQA
jgi:hypothetical protein